MPIQSKVTFWLAQNDHHKARVILYLIPLILPAPVLAGPWRLGPSPLFMLRRGEVSSLTGRLWIAQNDYYKDKLISYLFTPPPPAPEASSAAILATVPQLLLMLGRETIQHI